MPKYKVWVTYNNYGHILEDVEDVVEADSQESAEEIAHEMAMAEVSFGAEMIPDMAGEPDTIDMGEDRS